MTVCDLNCQRINLLKSTEKEFIIYGPASVEIKDKEGDRIKMIAFSKSLPQLLRRGALTMNHEDTIVGEILEKYKENGNVYKTEVVGENFMVLANVYADTVRSREARKAIESGDLRAYSISGTATKSKVKRESDGFVNEITEIDQSAVTLCEKGMNQAAGFRVIKKADALDGCVAYILETGLAKSGEEAAVLLTSKRESDSTFNHVVSKLVEMDKEISEGGIDMTDEKKEGEVEKDEEPTLADVMKEIKAFGARMDAVEKKQEEPEKKPDKEPEDKQEVKPEKKPEVPAKKPVEEETEEDEEAKSKTEKVDTAEVAKQVIQELKKSGVLAVGGAELPDAGEDSKSDLRKTGKGEFKDVDAFISDDVKWAELTKIKGGV